jgi:L-alanine-DL-glutamate epimerase-like enolase superfamily enzyme
MKITRIKTAVVEGNFDWTYVRVETDQDVTGLGECFFAPGLTRIIQELEPVIVGQDPRDVRLLFRKLQMAASGAGSVAGIVYNAITGIEMALWDLSAKWMNVPLYRLLGGKFRDRVRIYADCHAGEGLESIDSVLRSRSTSWTGESHEAKNYFEDTSDEVLYTPEMYGARAKQMVAKGYSALKFDVDVPHPYGLDLHNRCLTNREIDYMLSLIGGVRDAVGFGIDLAIDCHWRFNVNDARKIAAGCEEFRLMWLEDPLPPWNVEGFRELKTCSHTPIATGENLYLFEGFRELLASQSLSIVSPDLQKAGGFGEARRIAEFADNYNVAVAPHNISSPVGTLASVHFCAATPNFLALEFHANDVPFWDDLLGRPDGKPLIQNGYISVPDGPGLGFELNEDVARKYARKDEPFFE